MSLLNAVTNVANEAGYEVDDEAYASDDVTTIQLVAMAQRIMQEMADRYCWPKLWKNTSITLVASTATYALPGDFSQYHFDTWWNTSDGFKVYGPTSAQEYAEITGSGVDAYPYDRFTIRGVTDSQILISPTPDASTASQVIAYQYQSARPVRPQTWVTGTTFAAGSYCFYNGNYYSTTAGGVAGATAPTHTTGSASDGTVTWAYYSGTYLKFLADTDEPVLSQRILEQGMLERFAVLKGLNVTPMFDRQLDEEFSKSVTARTLYAGLTPSSYVHAFNESVRFKS